MWIYEFSYSSGETDWSCGVTDWVFAPNMKEAKDCYLRFTGCVDLSETTVKRVPKSKWSKMYLLDPNQMEPYDDEEEYNVDDYWCGLKIIETLAEYAERNTETNMIATTEY